MTSLLGGKFVRNHKLELVDVLPIGELCLYHVPLHGHVNGECEKAVPFLEDPGETSERHPMDTGSRKSPYLC